MRSLRQPSQPGHHEAVVISCGGQEAVCCECYYVEIRVSQRVGAYPLVVGGIHVLLLPKEF